MKMKWITNKAVMSGLCCGLMLWSLGANARVVSYQLDDTGRKFNPGDFISMNMDGAMVREVWLDTRGYRGATVSVICDGLLVETSRYYDNSRNWVRFTLNQPKRVRDLDILFGNVDPRVYEVQVIYENDIEVIVEVEYVEVEVRVPVNDTHRLAIAIRHHFEGIEQEFGRLGWLFSDFFYSGSQALWFLDMAGQIPGNTDPIVFYNKQAQDFLAGYGCHKALAAIHFVSHKLGRGRQSVRGYVSNIFSLIRALHWNPDSECSEDTTRWLNHKFEPWKNCQMGLSRCGNQ